MAAYEKLKTRTRDDYRFILDYRTRWADNDQYVCASMSLVPLGQVPLVPLVPNQRQARGWIADPTADMHT